MKKLTIAPRAGKRYLKLLEESIENSLPDALLEIILNYSGIAVLEDIYVDSNARTWELQSFDHVASMVDLTKEFKNNGWGLKLPFAHDPGGWHFCLSFDKETYGKILVNRWSDFPPEEQFIVIADSFEEFINGLHRRD